MRRMAFALACTLLVSGPALGAAGDVLTVTGDGVNVRSGPGIEHSIRLQVSRNQQLEEIEREGDWVHAELVGRGGANGWIHNSLVAPLNEDSIVPQAAAAEPAAIAGGSAPGHPTEDLSDAAAAPEAIAPGAASDIDPVDLQRFRDSVAYLNSRSTSLGGVDLFTEIEPLGGSAVQVRATEAWASLPPAGQRSYANTLLDRWAAATGRPGQVTVQIVDDSGQVVMEESKP